MALSLAWQQIHARVQFPQESLNDFRLQQLPFLGGEEDEEVT
jgi:hypothetical protein